MHTLIRRMTPPLMAVTLALVLVAPATAQSGQVYRWVDAEGRVHFGDQPPPGAELLRTAGSRGAAPEPEPDIRDEDFGFDDTAGVTRGPCMEAMEELAEYRVADVINQRDALGNERVLDEAERSQVLDRMAAEVEAICAGG